MKISIEQILKWKPCELYSTRKKIIKRTDQHWPKTPLEIADLDISIVDKFWVLFRSDVIDKKSLLLLACDFAEHVLPIYEIKYPNDDRPRKAIETKRLWLEGKATDAELIKAKNNAYVAADAAYTLSLLSLSSTTDACAAVYYAAYAAACAAYGIVYTADYAAAYAAKVADYNTEREWQLEQVREILKEVV